MFARRLYCRRSECLQNCEMMFLCNLTFEVALYFIAYLVCAYIDMFLLLPAWYDDTCNTLLCIQADNDALPICFITL